MKRLLIPLLLLGGCVAYTPDPLATVPAARPYPTPVSIDLARPLDGNAVATLAVLANPDLRAARARAGVADAQAFAARLLPDPTLTFGVSQVLAGPDPLLDLTSALGFDLNMLRTRGVRLAQARAAAQQVRLDLAWSEWQTAGQARLQAVRIVALERGIGLTVASRDTARSLLDRTTRAAGRGDLAADQVQAARLAAADAEVKARGTEKDLATARFELTRLLGLPPTAILRLAPMQDGDRPLDSARLFEIARTNRTDLRALEAGYAAQEAVVRKAVLDQIPTLGLSIGSSRDTSGNVIVGPSVDFTLPLWNRNRGGIAVERATRTALKAEYDARLFQTRAQIAAAVAGITIARRQRDAVLRDVPAARR